MQSYREFECPECRKTITLIATDGPTAQNEATVCGACTAFLKVDGDKLRVLTDDEIIEMPDDIRIGLMNTRAHIETTPNAGVGPNDPVRGPQIRDDRLELFVDGERPKEFEIRMMAAELLARRAVHRPRPHCPKCRSPNVAVEIMDDYFNYQDGKTLVRLCAPELVLFACLDCGRTGTDAEGELKRKAAVDQYLASKS